MAEHWQRTLATQAAAAVRQSSARPIWRAPGFTRLEWSFSAPDAAGEAGTLAFDGTLYHRAALRQALGEQAPPVTAGDAALFAAAVHCWGEDAPQHLDGHYSAVVWNAAERRFWACTDHNGQIPLLYARLRDGSWVFGTHLPVLLATPGLDTRLDGATLGLIPLAAMPSHRSAFKAIHTVPGGSVMRARLGEAPQTRRWWQPRLGGSDDRRNVPEIAREMAERFRLAVAEYTGGEGPVAATLSGGLDSSLATGYAARQLLPQGRTLHAYTSIPHPGLPLPSFRLWDVSEWPLAAELAALYPNIQHRPVHAGTPCLVESFHQRHRQHATPVRNSANAQWFDAAVWDARDRGCTVLLTGQVGNQTVSVDAGPKALLSALRAGLWPKLAHELLREPRRLPRQLARMVKASLPRWRSLGHAFLDYYPLPKAAIAPTLLRQRAEWVAQHFDTDDFGLRLKMVQTSSALSPQPRATDGVMLRDPTNERRLVEALLDLPLHATLHEGFARAQARLMGAGVVPDSIRWRTRRGAQSPEESAYFALHAAQYREAWQEVSGTFITDWFQPAEVSALLDRLIAGQGRAIEASFMHRILDIGLFGLYARQQWGSTLA